MLKKEQHCRHYHDVSSNTGDLQGEWQHVELTHDQEDQLGVCPCQLQQVQEVRRVTDTHIHIYINVHILFPTLICERRNNM